MIIILREMLLTYFLRNVFQLIKQAKKKVSEKCLRTVEILKHAIMKNEMDEKVDAYEKQLRSKYIKLMS